jgi:hypothetical protein
MTICAPTTVLIINKLESLTIEEIANCFTNHIFMSVEQWNHDSEGNHFFHDDGRLNDSMSDNDPEKISFHHLLLVAEECFALVAPLK